MAVTVENHPQRKKIDELLAKGESCRTIAASLQPPLHFATVARYAQRLSKVLERENAVSRTLIKNGLIGEAGELTANGREVMNATTAAVSASPFLERVAWLWDKTRNGVERAEGAVRTVRDRDTGEEVAIGQDFQAFAAMLREAHRNAELFGRGTGALDSPNAGPSTAVVVIMPHDQREQPITIEAQVVPCDPSSDVAR